MLDREQSDVLPLHEEIAEQIGSDRAVRDARRRSERILSTLEADLSSRAAPWYTETWLPSAMKSAERRFDESFDRWRSLFRATASQIRFANQVINNAAATERERREAKARYDEAYTQQNLLLGSRATMNSRISTPIGTLPPRDSCLATTSRAFRSWPSYRVGTGRWRATRS